MAPRSCPIFHLEGFADVPVLKPGLSFYLDLLDRSRGFAFVKRTHGFWDGLVFLGEEDPEIAETMARGEPVEAARVRASLSDRERVEILERRSGYIAHFRDQFYSELVEDLQAPLAYPAYIEANSFRGYPNSDARPAHNPVESLRRAYRSFHTSGRRAHDALVWKQAILDGTFWRFVEMIGDRPVLVIGPAHLSTLGRHLGLDEFHHITIPIAGAPTERHALFERCSMVLRQISERGRPAVVLYQAGALAFWLIYRLYALMPTTTHLDLGRCLDVWYPDVVGGQPWFVQNRGLLIERMRLNHLYS
jgi:hypothetical protein